MCETAEYSDEVLFLEDCSHRHFLLTAFSTEIVNGFTLRTVSEELTCRSCCVLLSFCATKVLSENKGDSVRLLT